MLQFDAHHIQTAALVEAVTDTTILYFATKLASRSIKRAHATYIRGGRSGASTLNVNCDLVTASQDPPLARSLLLKLSKDPSALTAELNKDVSVFYPDLFIPFLHSGIVSQGDWHCLGSDFESSGKMLLDWLRSGVASKEDIEKTLTALFSDRGLAKAYRNPGPRYNTHPVKFLWELLVRTRRDRIAGALDELLPLAKDHDKLAWLDPALVHRFLSGSQLIGDLDGNQVPPGTCAVWSHGDLHSRNILVDESGRARLIDRERIQQMHWACDVARLLVDILVSGLDGDTTSYEWNAMEHWCECAVCLVRNERLRDARSEANVGVQLAATWLRSNWQVIHACAKYVKPEWQFILALAIEFLRASYRPELPPPKRFLGLVAGCQALRETALAFRDSPPPATHADS